MPPSLVLDSKTRSAVVARRATDLPGPTEVEDSAATQVRQVPSACARPDSWPYAVSKRILDIVLSAAALVVAAPIMALIALAIRLESKGPAIFGQVRLGKQGTFFRCYKFRTMRDGAQSELLADPKLRRVYEENNFKIPAHLDPRVTRLGHFLRKSSLDELPQLLNVIGGSMSLVGPRPIVPDELKWYDGEADLFLSVRPGITGAWQVSGRNRIRYPERAQVELEAIRNGSLVRDLKVLAATVPTVLSRRGSL